CARLHSGAWSLVGDYW
nr:immunoglobulin heavy chain junction region [Macaca mulatta]MOW98288.1 immunoglobulin heavy chain junction region [Macaca mulatta]MOW99774.1 immunoglobulin heavy chain junction region [Macaca mulatta]MOW99827.1 immunoglobulin heavy chain junction region [Macaca mulatta]MOW99907.1 immunoglobulin heavy chain junction region [Macaca mulatta]